MTSKQIIIYIILPLIIFLTVVSFTIYIIYKKVKYKLENTCYETIKKSLSKIDLMYMKYNGLYDIYVERPYDLFYFKIIKDTSCKYLKVTEDDEFFLSESPTDDLKNPLNLVNFREFKPNLDGKNRYYKVLVLYPNAKQKIVYDNKYFARFIYDDMKISDFYIINYTDLEEFLKNTNIN